MHCMFEYSFNKLSHPLLGTEALKTRKVSRIFSKAILSRLQVCEIQRLCGWLLFLASFSWSHNILASFNYFYGLLGEFILKPDCPRIVSQHERIHWSISPMCRAVLRWARDNPVKHQHTHLLPGTHKTISPAASLYQSKCIIQNTTCRIRR